MMEHKKSVIILILAIFLFGVSFVCASDANGTAITSEHNVPIEINDNNLKA